MDDHFLGTLGVQRRCFFASENMAMMTCSMFIGLISNLPVHRCSMLDARCSMIDAHAGHGT